jgi:hypothetical protein
MPTSAGNCLSERGVVVEEQTCMIYVIQVQQQSWVRCLESDTTYLWMSTSDEYECRVEALTTPRVRAKSTEASAITCLTALA